MQRLRVLPLLSPAALGAVCACAHVDAHRDTEAGCVMPVSSGPVADEIRVLEEAGAASNVTGLSVEGAQRMFWPDYLAVAQDGTVSTRESILRTWNPTPWASRFDIQELDIKVYCDMALVIGLSEAEPRGAPAGTKPTQFRWLNVWTQGNGEWRLSATQFTRLRPSAPAR